MACFAARSKDKHRSRCTGNGEHGHNDEKFSSSSSLGIEGGSGISREVRYNFCLISGKFLAVPICLFCAFPSLKFSLDSRLFGKTCLFGKTSFFGQTCLLCQAGLLGQAGFFSKAVFFGETRFLCQAGFFSQSGLLCKASLLSQAGFFSKTCFFG